MQLDTVKPIFEFDGPFVTIHQDVSRTTEDARQQLDSRWTTIRHHLEADGIDKDLVDELEERLREPTGVGGEVRRTIVAAGGRTVFDDVRAGHSTWPETVTVGPLPDLAGWLQQVDGEFPFLLVVIDREGADLDLYTAKSRPAADHEQVSGDTLHIRKVAVGDWAHRQFQQRSENLWRRNAEQVADRVREVCDRHRPRVVVVAGDVRARADLADALHGLPVEQIHSGGRAAGTSEDAMWADIRGLLARLEAQDEVQVVEALERGTARGLGVARGLDEVLDALVRTEAERVVLDLAAAREMTVTPATHPGLALPASALLAPELPADQVLVAAAAATAAEVTLLPRQMTHGAGVAATLRWDDRQS